MVKKLFYILFTALLFTSCVSKKKYKAANDLAQTKSSEKDALEEVLNKLVVENDSLKKWVVDLDSLYRIEREKNNSLPAKNESRGIKFKSKLRLISAKEEYEKKALFIYSFISYIAWPPEKITDSFNIGIIGETPIKTNLVNYVAGKQVNKLPIKVESYHEGGNYQILFFSENGIGSFNKIKKQVSKQTVLLVTENSILENIGSHVSLFLDGTKVKFSANKNALTKSKLKVSNSFYSLSD